MKHIFNYLALFFLATILSNSLFADNASVPTINIQVSIINEDVKIEWTSYTPNSEFKIEVASHTDANGILKFNPLAKIKSNGSLTYQFIDNISDKNGLMYYRVIENTTEGIEIISDLATANFTLKDKFTSNVHAQPGFASIHIQINSKNDGDVLLELTDIQGTEIISTNQLVKTGFNEISIAPESQLTMGMYILSIQLNGVSQKILLENKIEENITLIE
jgi:hypothetical protein